MKHNPWLVRPRPNSQASMRLFCFPYSGGSASLYYAWASCLPSAIEVCAVQLPGRGTRFTEPLCPQLPTLVREIADALLSYFDKPFAFFGHSMGALIGFELARYLRRQYRLSPVRLLVSGHGAPQMPDQHAPLHCLPDAELLAKLRELKGMPERVLENAELLELVLPILRADLTLCETYVYAPDEPLDCGISAFGGLADDYVSRAELEAWQTQTLGAFAVRTFPGNHFFVNTARSQVLETIGRELGPIVSAPMTPENSHAYARTVAFSAATSAPSA